MTCKNKEPVSSEIEEIASEPRMGNTFDDCMTIFLILSMLRDTETTETEQETTETEHHQIALPSPNLASTKEQKKRRRRHDYLPPSTLTANIFLLRSTTSNRARPCTLSISLS